MPEHPEGSRSQIDARTGGIPQLFSPKVESQIGNMDQVWNAQAVWSDISMTNIHFIYPNIEGNVWRCSKSAPGRLRLQGDNIRQDRSNFRTISDWFVAISGRLAAGCLHIWK
jgi:hypothetical protein